MDEGNVLVMFSDGAGGGEAAPESVTLDDLAPVHGPRVPHGHSLAKGSFCFAARCIGIEVDFGSTKPRDDLVRHVNDVLASFAVGD
jgi:hypothetical protein